MSAYFNALSVSERSEQFLRFRRFSQTVGLLLLRVQALIRALIRDRAGVLQA